MQQTVDGLTRKDGRKLVDLRPLNLESGHLKTSNGSCRLQVGKTIIDCHIIGPLENKKKYENTTTNNNECNINVNISSSIRSKSSNDIFIEEEIKKIFESIILVRKYPFTTLDINVFIVSSDGSLLCNILNCVSMALLDSGIDCISMITFCNIGIINKSNKIILDPTMQEIELLSHVSTIGYSNNKLNDTTINSNDNNDNNNNHDNSELNLMYLHSKGNIDLKFYKQILLYAKNACFSLQFYVKKTFNQKLYKYAKYLC